MNPNPLPPTSDTVHADTSVIPPAAIIALSFGSFGSGMSMRVTDAMLVRLAAAMSKEFMGTIIQVINYRKQNTAIISI